MSKDDDKRKTEDVAGDVLIIGGWIAWILGFCTQSVTPVLVMCLVPVVLYPQTPVWANAICACGIAVGICGVLFKAGRYFKWW